MELFGVPWNRNKTANMDYYMGDDSSRGLHSLPLPGMIQNIISNESCVTI